MAARDVVVAQFEDYDAAQRAAYALLNCGTSPADIHLASSDAVGDRDPDRVPEGRGFLTVLADDARRVRTTIEQYGPAHLENHPLPDDEAGGTPVTLSGAPADHSAGPGGLPHAGADEWLIRKEGALAAEFDPDRRSKRKR